MRRERWLLVTAAAVLLSGGVHFWLYFRGGYRGIAPDEVLGLTISRAFVLNALGGVVLAELLVLALRIPRLVLPATIGAGLFGAATLGAYFLSRTVGLLGFTEDETSLAAVIAAGAEVLAIIGAAMTLREARTPEAI